MSNYKDLINQVYGKITDYPAKIGMEDKWGKRYSVIIPIIGPNGNTANVKTAWIIEYDSTQPRLVSIYVDK